MSRRDCALHAPMDGRVEEVLDEAPLVVRQIDHCAHAGILPDRRDTFYGMDGQSVRRQSATGSEALAGGDVDALDELLAPNYHNPMMGGIDRAGFKAMLPAMRTVISDMSFDIVDLVAEGDAVVARFTSTMTLATGK